MANVARTPEARLNVAGILDGSSYVVAAQSARWRWLPSEIP